MAMYTVSQSYSEQVMFLLHSGLHRPSVLNLKNTLAQGVEDHCCMKAFEDH